MVFGEILACEIFAYHSITTPMFTGGGLSKVTFPFSVFTFSARTALLPHYYRTITAQFLTSMEP